MTAARQPRDEGRAAEIMRVAARLFREKGYHATSIDEIGAAAGITGPAIYSHFRNKEALLISTFLTAIDEFTARITDVDGISDPIERLDVMNQGSITAMLNRSDEVTVYLRERRQLEGEGRAAIEQSRRNELLVIRALREARPGMTELQADLMAQAVTGAFFSLLHHRPQVSRERLGELLIPAARAAMMRPALLGSEEVTSQPAQHVGSKRSMVRASRREMLISVAIELFRRRSFAGVAVGEITEAAGIAAPGLYRHFSSKEDLLSAIFVRAREQLSTSVDQALTADEPGAVLDGLLTGLVDLAVDHFDLRFVYLSEMHSLGPENHRANRRAQRSYGDEWVRIYRQVRPELSEAEAIVLVQAAIGLTTGYNLGRSHLPAAATRTTLIEMGRAVLAAPEPVPGVAM